jgi:hypothetical protein
MSVRLDLPPEVETAYVQEAQARGVEVGELLRDILVAAQPLSVHKQIDNPEEWVRQFRAWVNSHPGHNLPLLSDEAMSREFIYRDRGL